MHIISHYAPHGGYDIKTKESHWELLNDVLGRLDKRNPKLIIGDCNARIHGRRDYEGNIIGPVIFGRGVEYLENKVQHKFKENHELLLSFCREHELRVMNTWRDNPPSKLVTYKEMWCPNPLYDPVTPENFAQIDLVLCSAAWSNMVHRVYSSRGADLATSQCLLTCTLQLKLGSKFSKAKCTHQRYDRGALRDLDTAYYFKSTFGSNSRRGTLWGTMLMQVGNIYIGT